LQCVAVCCSVLQCVAVCCSVLQCVAVCCSVLQYTAVRCSVLQCAAVCCSVLQFVAVCGSVLQCAAVCFGLLPCIALYCRLSIAPNQFQLCDDRKGCFNKNSLLQWMQCDAVCLSVLQRVAGYQLRTKNQFQFHENRNRAFQKF